MLDTKTEKTKHTFLRRVVRLCLIMMVLLTLAVIVMAVIRGETIETGALSVLIGGWCGELLLSLLKRKFEIEDKADLEEDSKESVEENPEEEGDG